jgi:lysophospholipase L1-like esterase
MKYLALGDSYTIGELVAYQDSFPHQVADLLNKNNIKVEELKLIAKTGWTTYELIGPMEHQVFHHDYDWTTLLIGVNNQYRGRSVEEYAIHFSYLLNRAINFTKDISANVIVLSIPDWGATPFNTERDALQISKELDDYNTISKNLAQKAGAHFIDITNSTRLNAKDSSFLAEDKLHPSGKEYAIWAEKVASIILK